MKLLKYLAACIFVVLVAGCAGRFRGPAGEIYHVHSSQGVALFKIKSPDKTWYTNKNISAGRNEALVFDSVTPKSDGGVKFGEELTVDFEFGKFLHDNEYFAKRLATLSYDQEGTFIMGGDSSLGNYRRSKKIFKGKTCFFIEYEEPEVVQTVRLVSNDLNGNDIEKQRISIRSMAEVAKIIECPGFFRNTFGVLQISMRVSADSLEHAKSIFIKRENDFNKAIDSFEFLYHFSQEIPSEFSLENQLIMAIERGYVL